MKDIDKLFSDLNKTKAMIAQIELDIENYKNNEIGSQLRIWDSIKAGEPVLVRDDINECWRELLFNSYCSRENKVYTYPEISNQCEIKKAESTTPIKWNLAKLDGNRKSIINWITNTGVSPKCKTVLVNYSGRFGIDSPESFIWDLHTASKINRYAILD